ncbi:MAG: amidohydrolase/deacetylase family metallohydrolase [candidate division Zixibacteria bacterium]|nr:amidohydrolase/deacetylase family metallohydrolase [candidate division Zixibacteria bacterium]
MYTDLLLKGGIVVDPAQAIHRAADVLIHAGRITAIGTDLPAHDATVVDVKNHHVFPGLIDLHTHICWSFSELGLVPDDICLPSGVTTVVDAGTSSWPTMIAFRKHIAEPAVTRVIGFSNISSLGIPAGSTAEVSNLHDINVDKTAASVAANRDLMVGVKVRQGIYFVGNNGVEPTRLAVKAAEQIGVPVMVHVGKTPCPLSVIMDLLRPGDIITHTYHGHDNGILDDHRAVWPEVIEGRKRGILMDVGHGGGSFKFDVAQAAFERGFFPDAISTDVYTANVNGPVFDLPTTMSKMLNLGMPLYDVIASTTCIPAKAAGRTDIGTLSPGIPADVAVFDIEEGEFSFRDCHGDVRIMPRRFSCVMTIRNGKVVYKREKKKKSKRSPVTPPHFFL